MGLGEKGKTMLDLIQFQHPERIHALWIVLCLVVFYALMSLRSYRKLDRFMSSEMQLRLVVRPKRRWYIFAVISLFLAALASVFAWMQPQIVRQETTALTKEMANIYVVLDVSKSMLATDVVPNRLDRAKSEILDMLPSFTSHRVGLIVFAGRASIMSPLTMDHGFFRLALDSASPRNAGLGGTNIGEAIQKATKVLADQEGPKAILLISDGEDHGSYPLDAAKEARRAGITIVSVGFGSEQGTTLDVLDRETGQKKRILDSSGQAVISKLDGKTLREIALVTEGVYVPAGTGVLDLEGILKRHIIPLVEAPTQLRTREIKVELFQWAVALSLFFFLAFILQDYPRLARSRKADTKLTDSGAAL